MVKIVAGHILTTKIHINFWPLVNNEAESSASWQHWPLRKATLTFFLVWAECTECTLPHSFNHKWPQKFNVTTFKITFKCHFAICLLCDSSFNYMRTADSAFLWKFCHIPNIHNWLHIFRKQRWARGINSSELGTSLFEIALSLFALERTLILGAMVLLETKSEALWANWQNQILSGPLMSDLRKKECSDSKSDFKEQCAQLCKFYYKAAHL